MNAHVLGCNRALASTARALSARLREEGSLICGDREAIRSRALQPFCALSVTVRAWTRSREVLELPQ